MSLPQQLPLPLMQTKWAQQINPVLANTILQGIQLTGVNLVAGANSVNHRLGRKQQGWFVTDINAISSIYRSAAFNDLTLTLTSSAVCTVNLWVY